MFTVTLMLLATLSMQPDPSVTCTNMRGRGVETNGTHMTLTISDDAHCLQVTVTGKVDVTDDDADIRTLSPGGSFVVAEASGRDTRTLRIEERGGRLLREYTVNGAARAPNESADWLRGIMLELVRGSGIDAEARVARIRRRSGVRGVLDEVALIKSDHVKQIYLEQVLRDGSVSDDEARRIALTAGERIGSDHDKSSVLHAVIDLRGDRRDVAAAVVRSAESVGSSHDRSAVLQRLISRAPTVDGVLVDALDAARGITSDHDRGEVLTAFLERASLGAPAVRAAFFRALDGMGSDHDRRVVLERVVSRDATNGETARAVLASTARLGSDHDKSEVLIALLGHADLIREPATRAAFDAALKTVGSDSDYRRVAQVLVR